MIELLRYYTEAELRGFHEKNPSDGFIFKCISNTLMASRLIYANGAHWLKHTEELNGQTIRHEMHAKASTVKCIRINDIKHLQIFHSLAPQWEGHLSGDCVTGTLHVGVRWGRMKSIKDPSMYHWNDINLLKLS